MMSKRKFTFRGRLHPRLRPDNNDKTLAKRIAQGENPPGTKRRADQKRNGGGLHGQVTGANPPGKSLQSQKSGADTGKETPLAHQAWRLKHRTQDQERLQPETKTRVIHCKGNLELAAFPGVTPLLLGVVGPQTTISVQPLQHLFAPRQKFLILTLSTSLVNSKRNCWRKSPTDVHQNLSFSLA